MNSMAATGIAPLGRIPDDLVPQSQEAQREMDGRRRWRSPVRSAGNTGERHRAPLGREPVRTGHAFLPASSHRHRGEQPSPHDRSS